VPKEGLRAEQQALLGGKGGDKGGSEARVDIHVSAGKVPPPPPPPPTTHFPVKLVEVPWGSGGFEDKAIQAPRDEVLLGYLCGCSGSSSIKAHMTFMPAVGRVHLCHPLGPRIISADVSQRFLT
jgi:hypothetical protein